MTERTTSSSWAQGIVQALESSGLDCRALFAELGLDYAALQDPDARFAQDDMTRLWHRAVAVSGDPAVGLNMARQVRPAALNVVGYALMSSRNLKEGFARLVRYQRIIAEGADLDFQPCAQGYRLSLTIQGDRLPPAPQSAEGGRWRSAFRGRSRPISNPIVSCSRRRCASARRAMPCCSARPM